MIQDIAVVVIVALAVVYATWKLSPRALRARFARATVGWAQRRGRLSDADAAALAQRLTASGCGSCDSCGTCSPAAAPKAVADASSLRFVPGESGTDRASR
jgi:hypothetical protein